jgi:hypothetical protein
MGKSRDRHSNEHVRPTRGLHAPGDYEPRGLWDQSPREYGKQSAEAAARYSLAGENRRDQINADNMADL